MPYTVVQHSGTPSHPEFAHTLESAHVAGTKEIARVQKAGGLLFSGYKQAEDACDKEQWPGGYTGWYGIAPGTFSVEAMDGRRIYIPVEAQAQGPQLDVAGATDGDEKGHFDAD